MVIETSGPDWLAADKDGPADPANRFAPQGHAEETPPGNEHLPRQAGTSGLEPPNPDKAVNDTPLEPGEWVPFRSSWQPSAQTWQPLAESWKQARGDAAPPEAPALEPKRIEMPGSSVVSCPSSFATETRDPARPERVEGERAAGGLTTDNGQRTTDKPERQTPAAGPVIKEEIPSSRPVPPFAAWEMPLVYFNRAFDACLAPWGAAGRWLRGPAGRSILGTLGVLSLGVAVVLAVADVFGWTW
jgi:hypothetical protein